MRKLATIETISEIKTHNNADSLELAMIRGWQVVVRKNEFKVGDKVIYIEIDSWVPHTIAPFLSKGQFPRVYEGVEGQRLRTIQLRKELSQGLILPIEIVDPSLITDCSDGFDLTEILGILKWEPTNSAHLAGKQAGLFPSFLSKTDQERIQNCFHDMASLSERESMRWVIEEKLDGSSTTVYVNFENSDTYEVGVCSRNFKLKLSDDNKDNTYVKTVSEAGYLDNIHKLGKSFAIQGELCGPGIQGNKYKLQKHIFYVFDVYLIDERRYASITERWEILQSLISLGVDVQQVPHLGVVQMPDSVKSCLEMADGKSKVNPQTKREGIVFKAQDVVQGKVVSFKAISNSFLLSYNE